jgi:hypothetical protein
MIPSSVEIAWAAGLFEGEGCITTNWCQGRVRKDGGCARPEGYVHPRLALVSTDYDIICKLHRIAGGKIYGPYKPGKKSKKIWWSWQIQTGAVDFLRLIFPYLGYRRQQKAIELYGKDGIV